MIIDIVLVIILIAAMLYGIKQGLLKVVARLLSTIVAFVLAYMFADVAAEYIANQPFVVKNITPVVESFLNGTLVEGNIFLSKVQEVVSTGGILKDPNIAVTLSKYIYLGLGFALVFILVRVVLWVAVMMLDNVLELPIINSMNKVAGCIAAVVLVYLETSVVLAIIQLLGTFNFMDGIMQLVNSSVIAGCIFEHNIVLDIIMNKII